jgi:hypothetical protein
MSLVRSLAKIFVPLALGIGTGIIYDRSVGEEATDIPTAPPSDQEHGEDPQHRPDNAEIRRNAVIIGSIVFLGFLAGATGLTEKKKPEGAENVPSAVPPPDKPAP